MSRTITVRTLPNEDWPILDKQKRTLSERKEGTGEKTLNALR